MLLPHQKVGDVIWFHLVNSFRSILDSNQTLYSLIELNRFCYVFSISYRTFVHNTLFYRDMNKKNDVILSHVVNVFENLLILTFS